MTDGAEIPAVPKLHIGHELRKLREAAGVTQQEASAELEWSLSKVLRIENGTSRVSVTDLRALVAYYGVDDADIVNKLASVARVAKKRAWRDQFRKYISPDFYAFLGYEESAYRIRQYQSITISPLLQTLDYARAVAQRSFQNPDDVARSVMLYTERNAAFLRNDQKDTTFLLDEAVLRREFGDSDIMKQQLRHLIDLMETGRAVFHVVPFNAGAHRGMHGPPMTIFDLAGDLSTAYVEDRFRQVIAGNKDIGLHERDFASIAARALSPDKSVKFITTLLGSSS